MPLRKIADAIVDVLPKDIAKDVRGNTRVMVQSALEKMDLVSREAVSYTHLRAHETDQ